MYKILEKNKMKNTTPSAYSRTITIRLNTKQSEHIKSQVKPSDYMRKLIERDLEVVSHDKI